MWIEIRRRTEKPKLKSKFTKLTKRKKSESKSNDSEDEVEERGTNEAVRFVNIIYFYSQPEFKKNETILKANDVQKPANIETENFFEPNKAYNTEHTTRK